jgi:hypothetical protein
MGKIIRLQGTKDFPDLDTLLGGYFHQDFDIFGNTLAEVVATFKKDTAPDPDIARRTRSDIARFLAERPDDKKLDSDFEEYFDPGVLVNGWEPEITTWRQWLTRVSELLEFQPSETHEVPR